MDDFKIIDKNNFWGFLEQAKKVLDEPDVVDAFKRGSNIILDQTRQNFFKIKKDKSTSNYQSLFNSLKYEIVKNQVNDYIGVKTGLKGVESFKYRWIEYGTKTRKRKSDNGSTGRLTRSNFFNDAVEQKGIEAQEIIINTIIKTINKAGDANNKS